MDDERSADLAQRAAVHRALGDPHRLRIVDALRRSDRTPGDLARRTGLGTNLLAFHLDGLAEAGVITRRRYVRLDPQVMGGIGVEPAQESTVGEGVLFVCAANSVRSRFAAALFSRVTGRVAESAGSDPAETVHPLAVRVGGDEAAFRAAFDELQTRVETLARVA